MVSVRQAVQRHREVGRGTTARQSSSASCGTVTVTDPNDGGGDGGGSGGDTGGGGGDTGGDGGGIGGTGLAVLAVAAAGAAGLALRNQNGR